MKRVFFVMSTNDVSGAERVNFNIINCLKDNYEFYWVSKRGKINEYLSDNNIKWIEIEKLNVKEIRKIIKEFNPDIIHATDYKASVICSIAKRNTYLIEHLHNNAPWIRKVCINSFAFLFAALRADKILTVSNSIRNEYIFSKLIKDKIEMIGNPVDRKMILDRIEKDDYENKYDICCVARLTEAKNPKRFLDIIKKIKNEIKDVKAVWVGEGELFEMAIQYRDKLDLKKNVEFVGFKNNPYKYMAKSRVFLLTSDWEGYGLVTFEAMTIGLPCVVSNVGGLLEIVDEKCGKLCNENIEFEEETLKLLTERCYYENKSKEAVKKTKKIENAEEYIKKVNRIYKSTNKEMKNGGKK